MSNSDVSVVAATTLAADLRLAREDEKLAHDVYTALYRRWGMRVHANIASSEQQHFNTIGVLLQRYGVADPVAGLGEGRFATSRAATMYAQLVAQGNRSAQDALDVSVRVELLDIAELEQQLQRRRESDVYATFSQLRTISYHHLAMYRRWGGRG